ncbi:hypothetical protein KSP40_PGU000432 [Platanthera guangdongensis]|uniref:Uncharacterized protein n=1 Tax=Platanthera guangdongensis TaxID=2320717 RepID=A0ABR2MID4_9ASPA
MKKGLSKFLLSGWEVAAGLGVLVSFRIGLLGVYLSTPPSDYSFLKLPRILEELQTLSNFDLTDDLYIKISNQLDRDVGVSFDMELLENFDHFTFLFSKSF